MKKPKYIITISDKDIPIPRSKRGRSGLKHLCPFDETIIEIATKHLSRTECKNKSQAVVIAIEKLSHPLLACPRDHESKCRSIKCDSRRPTDRNQPALWFCGATPEAQIHRIVRKVKFRLAEIDALGNSDVQEAG